MPGKMTHRERVLAAIEHKPVDRVPVYWWVNPHTAAILIKRYKGGPSRFNNWLARRAYRAMHRKRLHPDLRDGLALLLEIYAKNDYAYALGADAIDAYSGNLKYWLKRWYFENGRLHIVDGYNVTHKIVGIYLENVGYPIKGPKELLEYQFPDASDPKLYDPIRKMRKRYPDTFLISPTVGTQDLTASQYMGLEAFYPALIDYPDEIKVFYNKLVEHSLQITRGAIAAGADAMMILDDYGHQTSTFVSMPMWREFVYPCLKRTIDEVHNLGAKAMLHSCGHQMPLLPHYVEAGLDALQAFQFSAGNDFEYAKKTYGGKLCFFTGLDVQLAQTRTPKEVRDDAVRAWRIGKEGSGFVLATTHNLQPSTPYENMMEMIDTVLDIQAGVYD